MVRGAYGLQRVVNLATALLDGLMPKADKAKLDAATSANVASTIVLRDGAGNFNAGGINASLTGNVTGNATTASSTPQATHANSADNATVAGTTTGNAGSATTLSAGADRTKLDSLDLTAGTVSCPTMLAWAKRQLATGKYQYSTHQGFAFSAGNPQQPVNDTPTPSGLGLGFYDIFCSYLGQNAENITVAVRPPANAAPDMVNQVSFQVALRVNAGAVPTGTAGTVYVLFIER